MRAGGAAVQRRGVQAAEVQGGGRGAEGGRQAQRHREGARQGDAVQRRAGRRGEGRATASPARCATPTGSSRICWWRPIPQPAGPGDRHGIVATEPDGSFTVPFLAKPDLDRAREDEPTFRYTVTADVTDTTGETRTGTKSVSVGYVALCADRERRRVADERRSREVRPWPRPRSTARGRPRRGRSRSSR